MMDEKVVVEEIPLEKVCRACLCQYDDMKSVFNPLGDMGSISLSSILSSCAQIKVSEGDGLPDQICMQCINSATNAFTFKQQVQKTDVKLRDYLVKKFPHLYIKEEKYDAKESIVNGAISLDPNNRTGEDSDDDCRPLRDLMVEKNLLDKQTNPSEASLIQSNPNLIGAPNHLSCDFCGMLFLAQQSLDAHRHTHRTGYVQCDICYRAFPTKKFLQRHKMEYHMTPAERTEWKKKHIKELNEETYTCNICSYIFEKKEQLDAHVAMSHQEAESTKSKKKGRPKKEKKSQSIHLEEPVVVKIENTTFDETLNDDSTAINPETGDFLINTKVEECFDNNDEDDDDMGNDDFFGNDDDFFKVEEKPRKSRRKDDSNKKYRVHKCSLCSQTFSRTNHIIRHMAVHNYEFPHKCNVCSKVYPNEELLVRHKRLQCENVTKPFQCGTCNMKFTFERTLEKHIHSKHRGEKVDIKHIDTTNLEKNQFCPTCNKAFFTQDQLLKHSKIHLPPTVLYECNVCQKTFRRKDNLMTHKKIHDPMRPKPEPKFLCIHCGRYFLTSSSLTVHMRRHTGEKPYKCDFCGKGFPRGTDMICHRRTHTGEKPWLCKVCGKGFSRSTKLTRHMRIHTGQKPYKCTFCDKAFAQSNDLTLHIRRHTGDKPYVCGICGDRFIQGTALANHRRTKGHFEEPKTPPLPANSVNNLNRDHKQHLRIV